ncbi:MAG: hypothetical protein HW389_1203, partial [Bacteroidetes bacterium]|nr:hypothetical protein [Bacteroidota bacterium]
MKWSDVILLLALSVLLVATVSAQQSICKISGKVIDDSTKAPIDNANVFIANSMMGTSSDGNGYFELKNVPLGVHELVASCVGYHMSVRKVQLFSAEGQSVDFTLKPRSVDFAPVEVTAPRPAEWKENLKTFTKLFLGTTRETEDCVIKNPEVLAFFSGPSGGFDAQSDKELQIDNMYLGYRLNVNLGTFRFDGKWLTSVWKVRFEDLGPADDDQISDWRKRRVIAYEGSLRHFFRALINGEPSEQGFEMLSSESGDLRKLGYYLPSLKRRNVLSQVSPNVWKFQFRNFLVVVYDRKRVDGGFGQSVYDSRIGGTRESPRYRSQASVLSLPKESLLLDLDGQLLDNLALKVSGDWGKEGLARSLPLE